MAVSDCELADAGLLGQPTNTLTALAFVVAGYVVVCRPRFRWVGYALIATGAGSVLSHGPMTPGSIWAHDTTLAWLILVVSGLGRTWERWTHFPGVIAIGLMFGLVPSSAIPVEIVLTAAAVVIHLVDNKSRRTIPALLLLAVVGILGRLGATGGPLCDPGSIVQPHGVWHLGAAVIVAWWVVSLELSEEPVQSSIT